jgi:predicted anti-sigma-YlaC factor YlaD
MRCRNAGRLLIDYIEDTLPEKVRRGVFSHLEVCSACRKEADAVKRLLGVIADRKLPRRPEQFWENYVPGLRKRMEEEQRIHAPVPSRIRVVRSWVPRVATACVLVLLTVWTVGIICLRSKEEVINLGKSRFAENYLFLSDSVEQLINEAQTDANTEEYIVQQLAYEFPDAMESGEESDLADPWTD